MKAFLGRWPSTVFYVLLVLVVIAVVWAVVPTVTVESAGAGQCVILQPAR